MPPMNNPKQPSKVLLTMSEQSLKQWLTRKEQK
jgi:hypothetical protein